MNYLKWVQWQFFVTLIFIFAGCNQMVYLQKKIEKNSLEQRRGIQMVEILGEQEEEVKRGIHLAMTKINEGNLQEALLKLQLIEKILNHSIAPSLVDQFFKLKCSLLFVLKDYKQCHQTCHMAMERLDHDFHLFYQFFQARLWYFRGEYKKSYQAYFQLLKNDFLSFSHEDCLLVTKLMKNYCSGFQLIQWADFCIEKIGFSPDLQDLVVQSLIEKSEWDLALAAKAEVFFFEIQMGKLEKNFAKIAAAVEPQLKKSKSYLPLLNWLGGEKRIDNFHQILETLPDLPLKKLIESELAFYENNADEKELNELQEIANRYKSFPYYHLLYAKIYDQKYPEDNAKQLILLLDKALSYSLNSICREEALELIQSCLNLNEEQKKMLLSSAEIEYLCRQIEKGGSPALVVPLIQLSMGDIFYFSQLAHLGVKRVVQYPEVGQYLAQQLKQKEVL